MVVVIAGFLVAGCSPATAIAQTITSGSTYP